MAAYCFIISYRELSRMSAEPAVGLLLAIGLEQFRLILPT